MTAPRRAGDAAPPALSLLLAILLAALLAAFSLAAPRAPAAPAVPPGVTGTPRYLPVMLKPPSPTPTSTPPPVTPPAGGDWRAYLGYYRALSRLPGISENLGWSDGAFKHARYMVENQTASGSEIPDAPYYSSEGAAAGANSLLQLQGSLSLTDRQALDQWMQWPFHALDVLDPALGSTGFGSYRRDAGSFDMAAALDVRRGLGSVPGGTAYPLKWPDHNTTVYLTRYDGAEQPDPLTSCPGFPLGFGSGLPVIVQIGPGDQTPVVTAHNFRRGATELEHCVFDETNYANSNPGLQAQGRASLDARDAIVLIPKAELEAGNSYTVSITVNGQIISWTFNVAAGS
ncbi:MAG: hypothetical protein IT317_05430 [Anaerolineales bacterium]|nr:hypothetical protein [Anaerolineales bacterium]